MIEKLTRMVMLFDFYGQLLTTRQREIMELFYQDDLSLSEIALEYGISRQAVFDILRRTENILEGYEQRLKLLEKFISQQEKIAKIGELVTKTKETGKLGYLDEILDMINEIDDLARK